MIRNYQKQDLNRIMKLWLDTNIAAHSFIHSEYWRSNYDMVKAMMPDATIYVYEEDSVIQGFIGLIDNYIAGIFVLAKFQSKGIGKMLLDYAKEQKDLLLLSVYKANVRAVDFYLREGFVVLDEQIDNNTGEMEFRMSWTKSKMKTGDELCRK